MLYCHIGYVWGEAKQSVEVYVICDWQRLHMGLKHPCFFIVLVHCRSLQASNSEARLSTKVLCICKALEEGITICSWPEKYTDYTDPMLHYWQADQLYGVVLRGHVCTYVHVYRWYVSSLLGITIAILLCKTSLIWLLYHTYVYIYMIIPYPLMSKFPYTKFCRWLLIKVMR